MKLGYSSVVLGLDFRDIRDISTIPNDEYFRQFTLIYKESRP